MPRTPNTTKTPNRPKSPAKPKTTTAAPAKDEKKSLARITAFNSHGQRYYRITLPREWAAQYESDANRWECEIAADGTVTFKPARELVKVS